MASLQQDTLITAQTLAKKCKELLSELYYSQMLEEGEKFNKFIKLSYTDSLSLLQNIENAFNELFGGKK
jgi:hypothetical protein